MGAHPRSERGQTEKTSPLRGRSGHPQSAEVRIVALCRLDNGQDINAAMVQEGWALAYREYATVYVPEENEAKAAMRGLWAETFIDSWDWRKAHRP